MRHNHNGSRFNPFFFLKNKTNLRRAVAVLASIVVFVSTYAMILPAIALEKNNSAQDDGIFLEEKLTEEAVADAEIAEEKDISEETQEGETQEASSASDEDTTDESVPEESPENAEEEVKEQTAEETDEKPVVESEEDPADEANEETADNPEKETVDESKEETADESEEIKEEQQEENTEKDKTENKEEGATAAPAEESAEEEAAEEESDAAADTEEYTEGKLEHKKESRRFILSYDAEAEIPSDALVDLEKVEEDEIDRDAVLEALELSDEEEAAEASYFVVRIYRYNEEGEQEEILAKAPVTYTFEYENDDFTLEEEESAHVVAVWNEEEEADGEQEKVNDSDEEDGQILQSAEELDAEITVEEGIVREIEFEVDHENADKTAGMGLIIVKPAAEETVESEEQDTETEENSADTEEELKGEGSDTEAGSEEVKDEMQEENAEKIEETSEELTGEQTEEQKASGEVAAASDAEKAAEEKEAALSMDDKVLAAASGKKPGEDAEKKFTAAAGKAEVKEDDYTISVKFDKNAGLPKETTLHVDDIDDSAESYSDYYEKINAFVGEDATIQYAHFYDLTLNVGEEEIEPDGEVSVSMKYRMPDGVPEGADRYIVHFTKNGIEVMDHKPAKLPEEEKGLLKGTKKLFSRGINAVANFATGKTGSVETAEFKTDGFSTYGVIYTVDFEYTDPETGETYAYTLTGGGDLSLSALFDALNIDADLTGSSVTFTTEGLLSFTPVTDEAGVVRDWLMSSLSPFDTEEELRVMLADGRLIVVAVTDDQIEKTVLASDGHNYMVKVSYSADSGIPEGAELTVEEILGVSEEYAEYVSKTENALGMEEGSAGYIRLFDIKIVDQDDHSVKYQPKEGTTVDVRIELADAQSEPLSVVHFGEEPEVVEATQEEAAEGVELSFEAGSFSVYAIVDLAPAETAVSVDDLGGNSYYLSVDNENNRYYFTNDLNTVPRIVKTTTLDSASTFTFEATEADEQGNSFYIYTYDDEGNKKYVNRTSDGKFSFGEEATTKYTVTIHTEGTPKSFHIYHRVDPKNYYTWHMNGDFEFAKNSKNNNNKIILTQIGSDDSTPSDPYGLDGESLGILWNVNDVSGSAMMSTVGTANSQITPSDGSAKVTESIAVLKNKSTTVKIDPVSRTDRVFVAQNSNISMWTFTCCGPAEYYITTVVNGQLKYVRFNDSETLGTGDKGISLVDEDEADERCKITVTEGTGAYSGKYKFSSNGRTLYNNNGNFFTKAESENGQNVWMYFAEQSTLNDDDFVVYTAKKVSVSGPVNPDGTIDYDVKDGDQVVLYTRIWNETTLEYEYYAIDYDGMLVRTYMSGDNISWVGSKINTMLWNFTEYHTIDADGNETDIPNYYYELQNNYSGKYIAPQVSGVGFLADSPVGINLNGRRYNEYYSTILAWDDPYYDYATLMADNYQLVSAPMSKAEDFYFAVMEPQMEEAYLSTVATVDSEPFGITLKMQNYGSVGSNNRSQEQTDVLQNLTYNQWSGVKNLLTKYIADGESYPTSTLTGKSLSALYSTALTVNHQFLLSTYQETGYFEYDSTQNFAHLITSADDPWYGKDSPNGGTYDVGDFVIYNQIASTTESTGDTRRHGQFFPYNDLVENAIITNMLNDTDIHGNPLSSLDPEKGEKLYKIQFKNQANEDPQYVDFFFGMEMDASFMQSASGLDAWGHDLIFEFSGDDDFWLYIDDVLVLDLGGIHSALDGTVNFRTGKVIENNKESTLRERFETAYKAQYPDKTNDEINEWLNGIFKDDGTNTGTVFKDYSGHTMKMFYMERGAGASNLHMRFNLAPYVNGEVQLEKEVSGTDNADASFPFQIWYENKTSARMEQVGSTGHDFSVCDTITGDPIRHADTYTVGGVLYDHVYFLKPGQTASITLPDESTKYYFVECGVDTTTYDSVKANDVELDGTTVTGSSTLKDYQIDTDTVSRRKKVIYNNHVSDTAQKTLTVSKRLWREFEKTTEIHSGTGTDADNTNFRFRVYIGEGSDLIIDGVGYAVYNIGKYYVKDRYGNYCIWQNGGFVSTGKTVFSELSTEKPQGEWKSEAEQATFYSSPGGAIDNIKAGYSVEIPGLMAGTPYYIEERAEETPSGYNLIGYTTTEGAYSAAAQGTPGNSGTITATDTNRTVSVHNQHGYGLVANKVWSDAPFMASHDDIYFGVYLDGVLINDTVRQLHHPATSINWFFPELKQNKTLNDYQVYELELTTPKGGSISVDPATGSVSGYTAVTKKEANDSINVGGVSNEHGYSVSYSYTVGYDRQVLTAEEIANKVHSRTDTISNSRPGIKIMKTDLGGSPLAGAKFVLTDESGTIRKNFTSAEDGLIVVSYLENDKVYTLTETAAPYGYQTLIDSITIEKKVDEDGKTSVYVNGQRVVGEVKDSSNAVLYSVTQVDDPSATNMPTITIRNKDYTLKAVKVDAYSNEPMKDVKFKLYKEVYESVNGVTNHNYPMPDYNPMIGYDNLITDENGVIPGIFMKNSETPVGLTAGTYYLREETPSGYNSLGFDIRITISDTGEVTLQKAIRPTQSGHWTFGEVSNSIADVAYSDGIMQITVKNTPKDPVRIKKLDMTDQTKALEGVGFNLYKIAQIGENGLPRDGEEPVISGSTNGDGILLLGGLEENISYYLYETQPLPGYNMLTAPVVITTIGSSTVNASLNGAPLVCAQVTDENGNHVWEITVYNSTGYELPSTGGPGTRASTLFGATLILISLSALALLRRKRA